MTCIICLISALLIAIPSNDNPTSEDWGFYGHRLINRIAVFTLPPELIGLYKEHIDLITEGAVNPDKRRYSTQHEAVRHYIDLDHWGKPPFEDLPRNWIEALALKAGYYFISNKGDTIDVTERFTKLERDVLKRFFIPHVYPRYYEETWTVSMDTVKSYLTEIRAFSNGYLFVKDNLTEHGIVPYHLESMQRRLTRAFLDQDINQILRLSSDMGHYIADAHVPLHTTSNYNGQLTGQEGIHAFWESRIPELLAEEEFDFLTGRARYIDHPQSYYWNIVLDSHALVDSVLKIELELRRHFPEDKQYCFTERGNKTERLQCPAYVRAFNRKLNGMVERRMRESIHAIGSAWFTAWVDAGQPDLSESMLGISTEYSDPAGDSSRLNGSGMVRQHPD